MSSAGSLWVEILPKFVGTATAIKEEVVPAATTAGAQAGAEISKGISDGARVGATEASRTIQASVVESAKVSGAEANAILAQNMTGNLASKLASELKAAESAVTDSALKMQAANAKAESSANQVGVAEAKLAEARSKYAADSSQVVAAEARLADAEAKSTIAADQATVATASHEASQASYVTARNKVAAAEESGSLKTAEAEAAQSKLNNTLTATIPGVNNVSSAYTKMGALIGVAIVVGLGEHAVKAAADFQTSQERLVTTAGEVQSNLKGVSDGILGMAGSVGISAQELSTGMYTVESAGFHGADALNVMKAAAQGAKEENADLTTVTDAVTSAMQDYHLPADQAALVTSKLVTAVSDGKTTFQDMTGAMSAVLPVASSVGVSMNEVLGDLSSMTLHGMSADQASQNLANAIRSLANPTLASTKELAALGLSASDLSKNLGKTGVQGTMEEISTAILQKMGPAGTTLLNAFNQSKQAAADASTMFANLPPKLQDLAKGFQSGQVSLKDWRNDLKALPADQVAMLTQWQGMTNSANGFSDALKNGGNASQTYTQALAKATGNSTSMNVALMLTGENAEKTKQNIADVGKATTEAGNNVKGWSDIQGTFNQKMAELKAGVGAAFIAIGTQLLPVVTAMVGGLMNAFSWIDRNRVWLGLLVAVIGPIVAVWAAWHGAILAWTGAIKIAEIAQAAWNAVSEANPVMLIVMAIAALVVGIIYAYNHFQTFRNIVAAVWDALKAAAEWVAGAGIAVWHALVVAFDGVIAAAKAIAAAFVWLWQTVLSPVFNFIGLAVRILIAIILTVLVTPLVLLFKFVLAPVFTWLYQDIIKPIFDLIATVFVWIFNTIIKPIVSGIGIAISTFGAAFSWLYNNVIKPVGDAIGAVWNWLYNNIIKPVIDAIKFEINGLEIAVRWLYDNVIKPVMDAIGAAWTWIYNNVIRPIVAGIKDEINGWATIFRWLYDNIIKPVGDAIGAAFHGIGQGISDVVDWIKRTWNTVKDIVEAPAKFVVQTVYDDAIVPVWNGIAGVFGLGKINPVDTSHWAGGGILPGYAPGVDSIPAMLSPGEAILTPEAARMLGYGNILKLNAMSGRPSGNVTNGLPIHAAGGLDPGAIWKGITTALGRAGGPASAIDGLNTAAGWVSKGVGAVVGEVGDLFADVVNRAKGTPNQSPGDNFTTALTAIPGKVIQGAIDLIKNWFSSNASSYNGGGTGSVPTGDRLNILQAALTADGIGAGDWPKWLAGLNTLITRESGWNAGAQNNWDSNAAAGHPSKGLMQEIDSTFNAYRNAALPGGIFDPVANVAAGIRYILGRYGDITHVQQADASASPKGYDSGGWLEPGVTKVVNASGRPEPVFSAGQWDAIKNNVSAGGSSGDRNYYITSHDPSSVIHEIERKEHQEMLAKLV